MAFIYFSLFHIGSHIHLYETVDLNVLLESVLGTDYSLSNYIAVMTFPDCDWLVRGGQSLQINKDNKNYLIVLDCIYIYIFRTYIIYLSYIWFMFIKNKINAIFYI